MQVAEVKDKPCLICKNARFNKVVVGDFCNDGSNPWFCFDCVKCELIGPYGERHLRTEQIMHDPLKGTYHIDGGESSSACKNYVMRNDFDPKLLTAGNEMSMYTPKERQTPECQIKK